MKKPITLYKMRSRYVRFIYVVIVLCLLIFCKERSVGTAQMEAPVTIDSLATEPTTLTDSLPSFPAIVHLKKNINNKDFIDSMARTYNISYDILKDNAFISYYKEIPVENDTCYLVEYNFRSGGGSFYPWKYQLIFNSHGECLTMINASKFWFRKVLKGHSPLLIVQWRTYHGNGTCQIYEIKHDKLITLFDGQTILGKDQFLQTIQLDYVSETAIYPRQLFPVFKDVNQDGYNDLTFSGQIETRSPESGYDNAIAIANFQWIFIYDSITNTFRFDPVRFPVNQR